MGGLEGAVAVVTGAGRGLDARSPRSSGAVARRWLSTMSIPRLAALVKKLGEDQAVALQADVSGCGAGDASDRADHRAFRADRHTRQQCRDHHDKTMKKLTAEWDKVVRPTSTAATTPSGGAAPVH